MDGCVDTFDAVESIEIKCRNCLDRRLFPSMFPSLCDFTSPIQSLDFTTRGGIPGTILLSLLLNTCTGSTGVAQVAITYRMK